MAQSLTYICCFYVFFYNSRYTFFHLILICLSLQKFHSMDLTTTTTETNTNFCKYLNGVDGFLWYIKLTWICLLQSVPIGKSHSKGKDPFTCQDRQTFCIVLMGQIPCHYYPLEVCIHAQAYENIKCYLNNKVLKWESGLNFPLSNFRVNHQCQDLDLSSIVFWEGLFLKASVVQLPFSLYKLVWTCLRMSTLQRDKQNGFQITRLITKTKKADQVVFSPVCI